MKDCKKLLTAEDVRKDITKEKIENETKAGDPGVSDYIGKIKNKIGPGQASHM